MKLSRNMQLAILIGGSILAIHFYYQLLYKPIGRELKLARIDRAQLKNDQVVSGGHQDEASLLEERYQRRQKEFNAFETEVHELESTLPSRGEMSRLLEQLTSSVEGTGMKFVSLEPTLKKAEEGSTFDSFEIEMQFYATSKQVIDYLKKLEESQMLLGIKAIEMKLGSEESHKPLVSVFFSTFISDQAQPQKAEVEKTVIKKAAPEPFQPESKPYDKRLPGDHHLTMVVWHGGTPVALIDGKIMKEGSEIDNKKLTKIESNGVWFTEDDVRYFLALET